MLCFSKQFPSMTSVQIRSVIVSSVGHQAAAKYRDFGSDQIRFVHAAPFLYRHCSCPQFLFAHMMLDTWHAPVKLQNTQPSGALLRELPSNSA